MVAAGEPPEELLRAGEVAGRVRDSAPRLVRPGESCRRICEALEEETRRLGAQPAFPCNISINEVAAHYTPGLKDDCVVPEEGLVKVDVGAVVDGYIADTAVTVVLGERWAPLAEAAMEALEAVAKQLKPGMRLYDVGRTIEAVARRRGFKPVRNLSGHSIDRYRIHAGLIVPNYADRAAWLRRLNPGLTVAIEPFVTNGRGFVREASTVNIYAYTGRKPRAPLAGDEELLLAAVIDRFKTLPFTLRWLTDILPPDRLEAAARGLMVKGLLHGYPVLVEAGKGMVSQFEHTFYIARDRVYIVTLPG